MKGKRRSAASESLYVGEVEITHPDKVLYPVSSVTKRDLAEYYTAVSKWMLPELKRRPLNLIRCPDGVQKCFFQHHYLNEGEQSPWIRTIDIREKRKTGRHLYIEDLNGLLSLVQLNVLEIHTWGTRTDHLEYPDRMVFDLDPSPEVSRQTLVEAALFLKNWLMGNGVQPFFKVTGGKGIHLVIGLKPSLEWKKMKEIAEGLSKEAAGQRPDLFVTTVVRELRAGKILLDYNRNNRGSTSIAAYSTRAYPGCPVALPISEKELTPDFLSRPFGIREAMERMKKLRGNPWEKISRRPG